MSGRLTWQKQEYDAGHFRDELILALVHSGVCVTLQEADGSYLFAANMMPLWKFDNLDIPTDEKIYGPDLGAALMDAKQSALATGQEQRLERSFGDDGDFEYLLIPLDNKRGGVLILTTIVDVSTERHRERVLKGLLREVSHRSKNMLAIILGLASQTAKSENDINKFLRIFRGRLFSLSASQDIVTDENWVGARLHQLAEKQIFKYLPEQRNLVALKGDNPMLQPNVAMHVSLALHELIVDMIRLNQITGMHSSAQIFCINNGNQICIEWRQQFDPTLVDEDIKSELEEIMSSTMLNRVVPASVSGTAKLSGEEKQLTYRLEFEQNA